MHDDVKAVTIPKFIFRFFQTTLNIFVIFSNTIQSMFSTILTKRIHMNIPNNDFGGFTDLAHFLFNVAEPSSSVNISYGFSAW